MESENPLINAARQNDTRTYNDAVTSSTSLNSVVDLFFVSGASRTMPETDIYSMLQAAWVENPLLTLKLIFWAGDIRGGQGERRFFRVALRWLDEKYPDTLGINLALVPEFNRWDSLFNLVHDNVLDKVFNALIHDKNGLCAKWMPRKKQYGNFGARFRRAFGINPKQYRKMLVELSKTVEQQMCAKEWSKIEYGHVPSVAFNKYRKAFARNDNERFSMFLTRVEKGEETIHADAIFPYQIYQSYKTGADERSINLQWKALPDYFLESDERILPICDVSGSMSGLPLDISVSLGVYLSERNKGLFKDAFVTFSGTPKMEYLKGTLTQRMDQLQNAHWEMNTNLSAAFRLILKSAIDNKITQDDMPTMLLVISDMEFDSCAELTNFEKVKALYADAGYKLPKLVFWNVNGRRGNVPISYNTKGVALVSGSSPSIVKGILGGKNFTPVGIMLDVLNTSRYDRVAL